MTCEELIQKYKPIAESWNVLKTDRDRWKYLLEHKEEYTLLLDNDATIVNVHIPDEEMQGIDYDDLDEQLDCDSFDDYLGWDDGVVTLLEVLGIDGSPC